MHLSAAMEERGTNACALVRGCMESSFPVRCCRVAVLYRPPVLVFETFVDAALTSAFSRLFFRTASVIAAVCFASPIVADQTSRSPFLALVQHRAVHESIDATCIGIIYAIET